MSDQTVQTLVTELKAQKNIELPEEVAQLLWDNYFRSVAALEKNPITAAMFEKMKIPMFFIGDLVAVFGPKTEAQPVSAPAAPADEAGIMDNMFDFKEINWTRRHVQRLTEAQVSHLMTSVLTKGDGWDFLTWAEREYGKKLAVQRSGVFAADATADLVLKLKGDKYPVQSDIFVYKDEDLIVVSVSTIGQTSERNRRDVLVEYGTVTDEGKSAMMQLQLYESGTGKPIIDEALLQMIEIAWTDELKANPILITAVATMLSMNPALKARDMKGSFPQSYAELVKRQQGVSDNKLPDLIGPEGENRPPFGDANNVKSGFDPRLAKLWEEIEAKFPIGKTVSFDVDGEMFYAKGDALRGGVQITIRRESDRYRTEVAFSADSEQFFTYTCESLSLTPEEGTKMVVNLHRAIIVDVSTAASSGALPSENQIEAYMKSAFDSGELRDLCFRLSVDYEDLAGETISEKRQALIKHMGRRNRTSELVNKIKEMRSGAPWDFYR